MIEPEVKTEFIQKMKIIEKEEIVNAGTLEDFKKRYGFDLFY